MPEELLFTPKIKALVLLKDGEGLKGRLDLDFDGNRFDLSPPESTKDSTDVQHHQGALKDVKAIFFVDDLQSPLVANIPDRLVVKAFLAGDLSDIVEIKDKKNETEDLFFREPGSAKGIFFRPSKVASNISRIFVPLAGQEPAVKGDKLGSTLIREGMISSEDLHQGLQKQNVLRKKRLGEIFVERGIIDPKEVAQALQIQKEQADKKIGDILIASGAIDQQQLEAALVEQKKDRSKRLGQILIEMDIINEEMLALALAMRHGLPYVDLNSYPIDSLAVGAVSAEVADELKIIPIKMGEKTLTVAFSDPTNLWAKKDLSFHTGLEIKEIIASISSIQNAIDQYYKLPAGQTLNHIPLDDVDAVEEIKNASSEGYDVSEQAGKEKPVIALVNHFIKLAVEKKASDIHVEPERKKVCVYFRIDGIRILETTLPIHNLPSIITRMKIMAGMNIAERRLPQDGRAKVRVTKKLVDLRFSCMPTVYGESMVIRVLDKEAGLMKLDSIGFLPEELTAVRQIIARPFGMMLVTGPTGSGKSSTIYACLQEPGFKDKNVITLEDPVEYEVPGLSQVPIRDAIGLTFASGLRQILRHDPDVIVVGEIRDGETAKIAVQAALTGHLLISTLHTNTAAEAFVRLSDMGIEPYLISSSILGILSQRLLRKICRNCITADLQGVEKLRSSRFPIAVADDTKFYYGEGCQECNHTGYKGRTVVYEFLVTSEAIKRTALQQATASVIREQAIKNGMQSIEQTALRKAAQGETSVEEIIPLATE